jgi:hypothetical protein
MRTKADLELVLGKDVAQSVFALKNIGDISPVVEGERGFFLFKLTGKVPGLEQNLESARPMITPRLTQEHRTQAVDTFIASLRNSTKVEIDERALEQVGGPASPSSAPAHSANAIAPLDTSSVKPPASAH